MHSAVPVEYTSHARHPMPNAESLHPSRIPPPSYADLSRDLQTRISLHSIISKMSQSEVGEIKFTI